MSGPIELEARIGPVGPFGQHRAWTYSRSSGGVVGLRPTTRLSPSAVLVVPWPLGTNLDPLLTVATRFSGPVTGKAVQAGEVKGNINF